MLIEKDQPTIDEQLIEEPIPEFTASQMRTGMIHATLSSLYYAINTILVKMTKDLSPTRFTCFNFGFWRGLSTSMALYYLLKRANPEFKLLHNIQCQKWLIVRSFGFFCSFMTYVAALLLLRVSLAQVLFSIAPIVSLVVAVFILKETFYIRYLMGIILCFIGSAIIVLNEKKNNSETKNDMASFYMGVFVCLLNALLIGVINVSQKVLMDFKMSNREQMLYVSLAMLCCSSVVCLFTCNFGFDFWIMFMAMTNGLFFFLANHYAQESMIVLKVGGSVPFNYLQTIFVFMMCVIILREQLFFTDILGSLVILSFHGYNSWSPIKK